MSDNNADLVEIRQLLSDVVEENQTLQTELDELRVQNQVLQRKKKSLEISLNAVTEHADLFENQLVEAHTSLESKIEQRTLELLEKNHELEEQVQERLRVESELRRSKEKAEHAKVHAQMANQAKSFFLAKMSHELRTPLNAIIGYSEMLEEDASETGEDSMLEDIQKIKFAGRHLLGLVSDVLDISKVETDSVELEETDFDVAELLSNLMDLVTPLQGSNALELKCPPNIGYMHADKKRVQQILQNLLSNGLKFTENGRVELSAGRNESQFIFTVTDTGIGIPQNKLENIFDAFNQVDNTYTRHYDGVGLGLTICRQLCRLMNAQIKVESVINEGSKFTVTFPVRESAANKQANTST